MGRHPVNTFLAMVFACVFFTAAYGQGTDVSFDQAVEDARGIDEGLLEDHLGFKPERGVSSWTEEEVIEVMPKRENIQTTLGVLAVKDVDVREVLEMVSVDSGLEMTIDDDVQGRVTIYLKEVDVYDALRIILEMNALAYSQEPDGRVHVMTAQEFQRKTGHAFGEDIQTKVVALQYASARKARGLLEGVKSPAGRVMYNEMNKTFVLIDAPARLKEMEGLLRDLDVEVETKTYELRHKKPEEIAAALQGVLTANVGCLELNERPAPGAITVIDTPAKSREAANIIDRLDQPPKEILVDARTVQVVLNDENQNGIDWEAIVSDYKAVDVPGADGKGRMSVGTVTDEDFAVLLEALDTVGAIHTVAVSRVSTTGNQKIDVVIKASELLSVNEKKEGGGADEAIRYEATPWFTDDGDLAVRVMPLPAGGTETDTKGEILTVPQETTIVIGGLFKEVTVEAVSKIPFLGDLPFLGFAFRRHGRRFCETEVITFLTPRVVVKE
jgi:type II secretory pathway component GspD/PulD (secretin)